MKATEKKQSEIFNEKTTSIKNAYLFEIGKIPEMKEYTDNIRLGKRQEMGEQIKQRYIERIETHIRDIRSALKENIFEMMKLKYPQMNSVSFTQTNGYLEYQTAKLFLSTKRTKELILSEITNALLMKRTDYVSALCDELLDNPQTLPDFKADVLKLVVEYDAYSNLNNIETEKNNLKVSLDLALQLRSYLTSVPLDGIKTFEDFKNMYN